MGPDHTGTLILMPPAKRPQPLATTGDQSDKGKGKGKGKYTYNRDWWYKDSDGFWWEKKPKKKMFGDHT